MSPQPSLLEQAERPAVADTSREAFEKILPTLGARQRRVLMSLYRFIEARGFTPTGGELTAWMIERGEARDVNGCRPRLTELLDQGLIEKEPTRKCRATGGWAHPCRPVLPLAAVEREQINSRNTKE